MCILCNADVVLHRYTDKQTGKEMGISYSDLNGDPAISNPDWNVEIIVEKDKDKYIKLQEKQIEKHLKEMEKAREEKAKRVRTKLKELGIDQTDLDAIIK